MSYEDEWEEPPDPRRDLLRVAAIIVGLAVIIGFLTVGYHWFSG